MSDAADAARVRGILDARDRGRTSGYANVDYGSVVRAADGDPRGAGIGREAADLRQRWKRGRRAAHGGGAGGPVPDANGQALAAVALTTDTQHPDGDRQRLRVRRGCSRGRSKRSDVRAMWRSGFRPAAVPPTWSRRSKRRARRGIVTIALTGRDGGAAGRHRGYSRERRRTSRPRGSRKSTRP